MTAYTTFEHAASINVEAGDVWVALQEVPQSPRASSTVSLQQFQRAYDLRTVTIGRVHSLGGR